MTNTTQTMTTVTAGAQCPAWCTTDHTSHRATWDREESGTWVHEATMADTEAFKLNLVAFEATMADTEAFKLNLVAFQGDGDGIVELGLPNGSLTATQAREVAAALLAAADALEVCGGAGVAR